MAGNHFRRGERSCNQLLEPMTRIIDVVIRRSDERIWKGVKRRQELLVGTKIVAKSHFEPSIFENANTLGQLGGIASGYPQNGAICPHCLVEKAR
jgi:hypothetical protein